MTPPEGPNPASHSRVLRDPVFVTLLVVVSIGFAWILLPFFGAVFWAVVLAILFHPLFRRLAREMKQRRSLAAAATVLLVFVIVVLPAAMIAALLAQEATSLYERVKSGEFALGAAVDTLMRWLPDWAVGMLERFGVTNLQELRDRVAASLGRGAQFIGTQALTIGQFTLEFVASLFIMLYVLFFLLRDGGRIARAVLAAIPLSDELVHELSAKFTRVIRATVKGNIVVAAVQGTLGGLIFWVFGLHAPVLWAVVMAFLALLPVVGTALVWGPFAIALLLTGSLWQGGVLLAYGVLVIGLADNVLRPILVGKDTKIPDFIVLLSTVGGIALFGLNGFVIGPVVAAMFLAVWDIVAASKARPGVA